MKYTSIAAAFVLLAGEVTSMTLKQLGSPDASDLVQRFGDCTQADYFGDNQDNWDQSSADKFDWGHKKCHKGMKCYTHADTYGESKNYKKCDAIADRFDYKNRSIYRGETRADSFGAAYKNDRRRHVDVFSKVTAINPRGKHDADKFKTTYEGKCKGEKEEKE